MLGVRNVYTSCWQCSISYTNSTAGASNASVIHYIIQDILTSMNDLVKDKYTQLYRSIRFERSGLFELIKKEFNPKAVIYPGCSIHITPSFYLNHVVYIDKSQQAIDFFSNINAVTSFINQNKTFKEPAYWKFIPGDFRSDLGLEYASFDLLLSLFSGKMIDSCERYIKSGGLIITSSLFSDNDSIKDRKDFELLGLIKCKNQKYSIDYNGHESKHGKSRLRSKNNGFEYIDNESYYLYRKKNKRITQQSIKSGR